MSCFYLRWHSCFCQHPCRHRLFWGTGRTPLPLKVVVICISCMFHSFNSWVDSADRMFSYTKANSRWRGSISRRSSGRLSQHLASFWGSLRVFRDRLDSSRTRGAGQGDPLRFHPHPLAANYRANSAANTAATTAFRCSGSVPSTLCDLSLPSVSPASATLTHYRRCPRCPRRSKFLIQCTTQVIIAWSEWNCASRASSRNWIGSWSSTTSETCLLSAYFSSHRWYWPAGPNIWAYSKAYCVPKAFTTSGDSLWQSPVSTAQGQSSPRDTDSFRHLWQAPSSPRSG